MPDALPDGALSSNTAKRPNGRPHRMKQRLYRLLEPIPSREGGWQRAFDTLIPGLIVLSVLAVVLRTDDTIGARYGDELGSFQWFVTVVFTVEYLLRLYACTADPRYQHPLLGRLRFALSPMAIVDLLAVLPFYLAALLSPTSDVAGAMLMLRMLRLLKLFRYSRSLTVFAEVLRDKAQQLVAAFLMTGLLLVFSSSLVYFAERHAQPNAFDSILDTMWWGIITLTTVGYGDMSPITPLGQLFGAMTAVVGIGLVALPSGILASGFIEAFAESEPGRAALQEADGTATHEHQEQDTDVCPRCGQPTGTVRTPV
jgi:voltage-gated potassium channel